MTLWIIEPRDPLIVRDGRPFGPDPGARAATLPFPFPSTIAGGLRGIAGRMHNHTFDSTLADTVRQHVQIRGPFLVELGETGDICHWFVPFPADAAIHELEQPEASHGDLISLVPLAVPNNAVTNLPADLLPVGQGGKPNARKQHPNAPYFWCWDAFEKWLCEPQSKPIDLATIGLRQLVTNNRMHVSIVPETQTVREGFLYQTRGLEFTGKQRQRLALAAYVTVTANDAELFAHFRGGMAPLGGERRLMRWAQSAQHLRAAPDGMFAQIGLQRACRIILLTPAHFNGFKPDLAPHAPGLKPQLVAAAVPRAQVVSGWDMVYQQRNGERGAPKPTRRLAPAGSVYFVRFDPHDEQQAIEQWARNLWMTCISDDDQSRRDGFGLVALGVWDGQVQQMGA